MYHLTSFPNLLMVEEIANNFLVEIVSETQPQQQPHVIVRDRKQTNKEDSDDNKLR